MPATPDPDTIDDLRAKSADMPFGSYENGPDEALATAIRPTKETSCHAVKREGGDHTAVQILRVVRAGIAVDGPTSGSRIERAGTRRSSSMPRPERRCWRPPDSFVSTSATIRRPNMNTSGCRCLAEYCGSPTQLER